MLWYHDEEKKKKIKVAALGGLFCPKEKRLSNSERLYGLHAAIAVCLLLPHRLDHLQVRDEGPAWPMPVVAPILFGFEQGRSFVIVAEVLHWWVAVVKRLVVVLLPSQSH
jgi:hypothetical protein